jgi:glutaredoxin
MNRLLVLLTCLAITPAFAWDPLSVLNNAVYGQVNQQINRGVVEAFRSIGTPSAGVRPADAEIRDARPDEVVIYTAPTCGYCKQALAYLDSHNIPYLQKDVSSNSQARSEWGSLGGRGVPLIILGKQKLTGFSAASFETAYTRFQSELRITAVVSPAAVQSVAATPNTSKIAGFTAGDVLTARIARVKLLGEAQPSGRLIGRLAKNEEVIYLGEVQGRYLKVRSAEVEGWADQALLAKP